MYAETNDHYVIRPMRFFDVDKVVNVHMESFQGFFLTFLGRQVLKLYYEGILQDSSGIGFSCVNRDDIIGFVVGFHNPSGFYSRLLKRDLVRFGFACIPAVLKKPKTFLRLLRAIVKPFEAPSGKAAELSSIAVLPHYQRRGIGRQLINAFIKEATDRDIEYVYLTTDALNNEAAITLYNMLGFKLYRKYETSEKRLMCEYRYVINKTAADDRNSFKAKQSDL